MKKFLFITLLSGLGMSAFFLAHFVWFNRPDVSVVMSSYNRASHLPIAIQSVLNQTMPNFELIVINDGSQDNTSDIIRAFAKKDKRVVFLNNPKNKGLIYSLNRGLRAARGKYIARIDDDDAMISDRLERQLAYMEQTPQASVLVGGYLAPKKDKVIRLGCPTPYDETHVNLHFANGLAHPTSFLRLSFLKKNNLHYDPEFKSAEDYNLWRQVYLNNGQIHCLKEPVTIYKRANDNPSSFYKNQGESARKVQELFYSRFVDNPKELMQQGSCAVVTKLIEENKIKKILNQERLEAKKPEHCPPETKNAYFIKHPHWKDYLIVEKGNKVYRWKTQKETGKITFKDKQKLRFTVTWDSWLPEDFMCDAQKECVPEEEVKK